MRIHYRNLSFLVPGLHYTLSCKDGYTQNVSCKKVCKNIIVDYYSTFLFLFGLSNILEYISSNFFPLYIIILVNLVRQLELKIFFPYPQTNINKNKQRKIPSCTYLACNIFLFVALIGCLLEVYETYKEESFWSQWHKPQHSKSTSCKLQLHAQKVL